MWDFLCNMNDDIRGRYHYICDKCRSPISLEEKNMGELSYHRDGYHEDLFHFCKACFEGYLTLMVGDRNTAALQRFNELTV